MEEKHSIYLDIYDTGVHLEQIGDFKKSYFRYVYYRAFRQLRDIIEHHKRVNEKYAQMGGDRFFSYRSDSGYEKFSNIMTFIGKRGSGKSSVMMSFMDALKYNHNDGGFWGERYSEAGFLDENKVLFTCLDYIDGSLLEHGEDIFKIVLAQIYQKFRDLESNERINKNEDFEYQKRELVKGLGEVYKTVCEIEGMEKRESFSGDSYMRGLQSLSSSQNVKKAFEGLVKLFTSLIDYRRPVWNGVDTQHYVVITIDDIDLNIKNGFSMLEKIHRYLMVSNVIILLSVDLEQMHSIVYQNFYDIVPKVDSVLRKEEGRIRELAMDYLEKVMPVNYRIYLPEINESVFMDEVLARKERAGIKGTVLGKIYRRVGICFDSQGKKRHFYEPKSMRNLTEFYLFLETMEYIDSEKIYFLLNLNSRESQECGRERYEIAKKWEANCRLLISDLANRIVFENVYGDKGQFKFLKDIMQGDIYCSCQIVKNFYRRVKESQSLEGDAEQEEYEEDKCSYGELVEFIYSFGRIGGTRYKRLVHCLLAYFSYAFTREYMLERFAFENDYGMYRVNKGNFRHLMGKNLLDKWMDDLMPSVWLYRRQSIGEISTLGENESDIVYIPQTAFNEMNLSTVFDIKMRSKSDQDVFQYMAEVINGIEVLTLFFINIKKGFETETVIDDFVWKFKVSEGKKGESYLRMDVEESLPFVGDFNVLSFIINSMYASEHLENIEGDLIQCMLKYYLAEEDKDNLILDGEVDQEKQEAFRIYFEKRYLLKQYEEWEKKYGKASLPFPIYWFDLTYNIWKRVRREMLQENPLCIESREVFAYIQKLFQCMEKHLSLQDKFYGFVEDGEGQNCRKDQYSYRLKDRFADCPVVRFFVNAGSREGNERGELIAQLINNMKRFSSIV